MGFLSRALGFSHIGDIPAPPGRRQLGSAWGDITGNVTGLLPAGKMIVGAVAHDAANVLPPAVEARVAANLIHGDKPLKGLERPTRTPTLVGQLGAGQLNYWSRALGEDPSDIPIVMGKDGKLYRNTTLGGKRGHMFQFLPEAPKSVLDDLKKEKRGRALWSEDPVNAPLAFVPLVGAAGKVAKVGKLAEDIQRANKGMKLSEARKIARKEYNHPGYAKSKGLEGGIGPRIIKGQYGTAEGRMRSRSQFGRNLQALWDRGSEMVDARNPESRFSSSTRAQAAEAKAVERQARRDENSVTQVEILLKKALKRRGWQTANDAPLTERQQDVMNSIIVALEHGNMTPEEAVKARIALHESTLTGGVSSAMTEAQIEKLGNQLEKQMDDITDEQHGQLAAYANDLERAQRTADSHEALAVKLATRRTPEETKAIRERLKLNPAVKRSEAEFARMERDLEKLKREHHELSTHIEDLLTRPNMPPSKRNKGLSTATRQLQKKADQLAKKRKEFRDALAWGHDLGDEMRRGDLVVARAEGEAENVLHGQRRKQYDAERRVQIREHRLADRQESSDALLADERAALDQAFDGMVANPRRSTPLSEVERHLVEAQMASLRRALDHPKNEGHYRRAVAGMRVLAEWVDETGREIEKMGKSPEEQALVDQIFDERQGAVGEEMVRRGILTQEQAGGAYFPHYSMWSAGGKEVGRGHGVNGPIVDGPNLNDYILNHHENDLQLLQRGMVDMSPTTLGNLLRNRIRFLSTHEAVQKLYREGVEVPEGELPKGYTLIRNPDEAKRAVSDRLKMAFTDPDRYERNLEREQAPTPVSDAADETATMTRAQLRQMNHESAEAARVKAEADSPDPDGRGAEREDFVNESVYEVGKGVAPAWVKATKNYRMIPTKVAKARLGEAVIKHPDSNALAWINAANMIIRSMVLYTPYGGARYITRNAIQNATLLALTQPGAFRHLGQAVKMQLGSAEEKALFREVAVEAGTVGASAGLPERATSYASRAKATERKVSQASHKVANVLGDVADEPFRVAAWLNYARKYDFDSPDEIRSLINDPKHAKLRDEISQRVREDLLDFDAATPAERKVINRILFLYPFMRASAKWPFMYGREYPVRTALAATLAQEAPDDQEYPGIPKSVNESSILNDKNWSIWDPTNPIRTQIENVQAAGHLMSHDQGAQSLADNVHPFLGIGLDIANGNPVGDSLTRLFPLWRNYKDIRRHGTDMGGQGTAFLGMEVRPPKHIRKQFETEAGKINAVIEWNEASGQKIDVDQIQPIFSAWKDWTALQYRATRASKDRGHEFTNRQIAVLYAEFIRKNYSIPVPSDQAIRDANDAQISTWKRQMDDTLWGAIKDPVTNLRENLRKLMLSGYTLDQISEKSGIDLSSFKDSIR